MTASMYVVESSYAYNHHTDGILCSQMLRLRIKNRATRTLQIYAISSKLLSLSLRTTWSV